MKKTYCLILLTFCLTNANIMQASRAAERIHIKNSPDFQSLADNQNEDEYLDQNQNDQPYPQLDENGISILRASHNARKAERIKISDERIKIEIGDIIDNQSLQFFIDKMQNFITSLALIDPSFEDKETAVIGIVDLFRAFQKLPQIEQQKQRKIFTEIIKMKSKMQSLGLPTRLNLAINLAAKKNI